MSKGQNDVQHQLHHGGLVSVCTIRAVCRKHELIQYELELAAQDLAYKKQQKEELVTGVMRP